MAGDEDRKDSYPTKRKGWMRRPFRMMNGQATLRSFDSGGEAPPALRMTATKDDATRMIPAGRNKNPHPTKARLDGALFLPAST